LLGVIEGVCEKWRVPYFSCRGYTSQSEVYAAAKRFDHYLWLGQHPIILYFGDHDPSGIDMTRDVQERFKIFNVPDVEVRRLALNYEQVEEYNPPPNPAKQTDSRFEGYMNEFGDECWELDSLEPHIFVRLVEDKVMGLIDFDKWHEDERIEDKGRKGIMKVAKNWDKLGG
jgi:hypothetical protein